MSVQDIVLAGGGGAFVLLTLLQIAPIKINPWSAIAKTVGRAINAEVLTHIDAYEQFCTDHPNYPNSRAVIAIANIKRVYEKRLQKNDFAR